MISESTIRSVADLEFDVQRSLFEEFGSVGPDIKGYQLEDGKVKAVFELEFDCDFATESKRLVDGMLEKLPVVATVAQCLISDSREAPGTGKREAVMMMLHTNEQIWLMLCHIERNRKPRLVKGELHTPRSMSGHLLYGQPTPEATGRPN